VYVYSTSTQSIYSNGVLEGSRSSNPYKDMNRSILIRIIENGTRYYFTGNIEQVSLIILAKTAAEILNDDTLVCYYSFESSSYSDLGPSNLNGSGVNVTTAFRNELIKDAISFTLNPSYLVVEGLTKLGIHGQPYSISISINSASVHGETIAHVTKCNYNWVSFGCLPFIGFTLDGSIAKQSWLTITDNNLVSFTGFVLPINIWTHLAQTYSPTDGMCLYINALVSNQSNVFTHAASGAPDHNCLGVFPLQACVRYNVIAMGQ
jgi:hypothetical protein